MQPKLSPGVLAEFTEAARGAWSELRAATQASGLTWVISPERLDELALVWSCSDFVRQTCLRQPAQFHELTTSNDLWRRYAEAELDARVSALCAQASDEAQLMQSLRRLRQREMVRIAWRDIAGHAPLSETTRDLSAFADACLEHALSWLHRQLREDLGVPMSPAGEPQQLVVLGMGKLGAFELNYSSDIDLIFAYPEHGETQGGRRCLSNEEYFRQLGQRLIRVIDQATEHGQVFRVDMRLRPFGESGPLAISFSAMEEYYQLHGREWERYALIKARVVAGDRIEGERLLAMLRPFIFRRYIDYGVFDALREMKQMIHQEVMRKGMEHNVKLGPGGIREVEFIGQAFQLIRGGREALLQRREILAVLATLAQRNYLPQYVVDELSAAYEFLRHTEHRLQEYQDRQTHLLPTDETGRRRLALSMGYEDWPAFQHVLNRHRKKVQAHFDQVITAPQKESGDALAESLAAVWLLGDTPERALETLILVGFDPPAEVVDLLARLRDSHSVRALSKVGRQRLDQVIPLFLSACGRTPHPGLTLQRVLHLVEAVARRSAYLALLLENPMALSQLVQLCAASAWLGQYLARHPVLLDELLDPRSLYAPPDQAGLQQELAERLGRIDPHDLEQQMEALRQFKQANVLRVAAADIVHAMPLMVVSDHLSWIAEVILAATTEIAWRYMVERHGSPVCPIGGEAGSVAFAIVAYGKLGGIELGYSSDLDLVFLYQAPEGATGGDKPLDNPVFFARLGQRIIHLLTAHTPAGVLYEVDLRLRPSGASGLLVSHLNAFAEYQRQDAWTWEHQALTRARVVVGEEGIRERFEAIRAEALRRPRDVDQLRQEVRTMRERMRKELEVKRAEMFDLKQGGGAIADIEFMVQYGVLAWAAQHPQLCAVTDNIRILEAFGALGLLPPEDARALCDAYRAYRARVHHLALQELPACVAVGEFSAERALVERIWRRLMEPSADG